jgi:hypothetical protein
MVLQNSMDLLKGELGSSSKRCVISTLDGNQVTCIEAETVSHIAEEEDQVPMTIPEIKAEPNVSCVPVVSVVHTSHRLHLELPAATSLCPCETKILPWGMDFEQFLRKEFFL